MNFLYQRIRNCINGSIKVKLRLDVDHACHNKLLSYTRLLTGLPIPFFLNHALETREFLKSYSLERIWMFRARTCPNKWPEPHGLHVTSPETFKWELKYIEGKLGEIRYFSRHGFAPYASGRLWSKKEIEFVEKEYNVEDITAIPHITISRLKNKPEITNLQGIEQILFHPTYIRTHKKQLEIILKRLQEFKHN